MPAEEGLGSRYPRDPQILGAWVGRVSSCPSLRTSKPTDFCLFLPVATIGDPDLDKVLPRGHGEGSGKFSVAVSEPEGGPFFCASPEAAG